MKTQPSDLNESIRRLPLPPNMQDLPISKAGFPVPFFAAKVGDDWDFRVVHPSTTLRCHKEHLCWICGKVMGSKKAFVVGPMCVITRTSAEPPSHHSCGVYAAIACPFLASPRTRRNEKELPSGYAPPAGIAIMRNPGCAAVLITRSYKPFNDGSGGVLFQMGLPEKVEWYVKRGFATYTDVMDSIESGVQLLYDECDKEDGPANKRDAYEQLSIQINDTLRWLPMPTSKEMRRTLVPPVAG